MHHYLPSLYFSILAAAGVFDILSYKLKGAQFLVGVLLAAGVIAVFSLYAPLTFGYPQSVELCKRIKLRSGWDWDVSAETNPSVQRSNYSILSYNL